MSGIRHSGWRWMASAPMAWAGIVAVIVCSWVWTLLMALDMTSPEMLAAPSAQRWGPHDAAMMALMWVVMMVAMMLPTAVPVLRILAAEQARRQGAAAGGHAGPAGRLLAFAAGYLATWSAYAVAATAAQWLLTDWRLLTPEWASASRGASAALVLAAGAWQFTPWKQRCLAGCRSPLAWLMAHWRPGLLGAWVMGLRHGALCVGCCWVLMALLFVAGVMNLLWIGALTVLALVEKLPLAPRASTRAIGGLLLAWGTWLALGA